MRSLPRSSWSGLLGVSIPLVGGLVAALAVACATGAETDPGAFDEDAGGLGIDAGRQPNPAKTDAGPLVPKPVDGGADAASDGGGTGDACSAALAQLAYSFDSGAQGWTHGVSDNAAGQATWPFDGWTQGTATAGTACKSGACFGAELTKNYAQCQRGYLLSPAIDLSACAGKTIALVFQHAHAFWSSGAYFDGGIVEVSTDGATWQVPPAPGAYSGTLAIRGSLGGFSCVLSGSFGVNGKSGFVGSKPTTEKVTVPLPANAISATTRVRFSMASGVSSATGDADQSRSATGFGWRIDDVGFQLVP